MICKTCEITWNVRSEFSYDHATETNRTCCVRKMEINEPSPTSEVGSALPTDPHLLALELQNRNLMEIIKNMQTPKAPQSDGKASHITLPKFNPDVAGVEPSLGAARWTLYLLITISKVAIW
ncbi:uncharacterized protein LOC121467701 [Drosophila elegans]|uniref:uncharacterized protein LOC121467701 n=1 Tax=Drosophila elegans TaxID=30023 RepID=UPI001BC83545|nr:uncharacterized protein LOC121467701 [Drosophila elegans]